MNVRYWDAEPNGLAGMIGGLIQGNLDAHPDRAALLSSPATYAIVAPDVDVAVSIRVKDGSVTVRNGVVGRPDLVITADSEALLALSSVPLRFGLPDATKAEGREVTRKLLKGELKVKGLLMHPLKLARLNRLLSVNEGG
ncbi:MAG: SCP2 sterol-binding domain-containing protein [Actinomycetota bacterium]|nr:SCP2 sterol-binding domain-containing protein [Actinomycetota bacterium]